MNSIYNDFKLVSVISIPFPWSPLKFHSNSTPTPLQLHSNSTPWSGNGVEIQKSDGVGVEIKRISGVGVEVCGVGVGMKLEILNF
jgi:hypothetical protein